jgi:hypothetical protein
MVRSRKLQVCLLDDDKRYVKKKGDKDGVGRIVWYNGSEKDRTQCMRRRWLNKPHFLVLRRVSA